MNRSCRVASLLRGGVVWALLLAPVAAVAQDPDTIDVRVGSVEGELLQLSARYLQPAQLQRSYSFTSRLSEGQVRYILGDYEAAAIILVDVVENVSYQGSAGYNDAVWLLADSLFLSRNFVVARSYFEDLVEANDPAWSLDAARRLLEVAFAMRDYVGLDALFAQMQSRSGGFMGPEIAYVRGKALYFQQRWDDAGASFSAVPADSVLFDRARYFVGTIHARQARWENAFTEFTGVIDRLGADNEDPELRDISDLSRLAIGRVLYEQQRWSEAITAYSGIERDSDRYDDTLYELAWSLIRDEQYDSAYEMLDILQVVATDRRLIPEAELLQADLLMRQNRWEDAVVRFDDVAAEYAAVEEELRSVAQGRRSPQEYFDALVNPEEASLRVPTQAQPWFRTNSNVDSAMNLIRDIDTMETAVSESRQIVDELELVVSGRAALNVFPEWREGWGRAVEMQRTLTEVNAALVAMERDLLWPSMNADARARYDVLRTSREELQTRYDATPRTFTEMNDRAEQMVGSLGTYSLEVYRSELQVQTVLSEVEALRDIVNQRRLANEVDPNLAATWLTQLEQFEAEARQQATESRTFRDRIRQRQIEVGVADEVGQSEQLVRDQYGAALRSEADLLAQYRAGAGVRGNTLEVIDSLRARSAAADRSLSQFFAQMDALVLETLSSLRTSLAQERASLDLYEDRLADLTVRSEAAAGEAAYRAFVATHARFSDITLRANLGIIDVSWEQKEDVSDTIESLFEDRNEALRVLDADFMELLDGQ